MISSLLWMLSNFFKILFLIFRDPNELKKRMKNLHKDLDKLHKLATNQVPVIWGIYRVVDLLKLFSYGGMGHWTGNYTETHSILNRLSHLLVKNFGCVFSHSFLVFGLM